jgi:hypothetical protein
VTEWATHETTTHQDHVIAHVIGATVLGYFIKDETAYLLLDIGFIWRTYLDGEMGLLPHPVAIGELETDEHTRTEFRADIDLLLQEGTTATGLQQFTVAGCDCLIQSVEFFARENSRRLVLTCEDGSFVVESSLESGELTIMNSDKDPVDGVNEEDGLSDAVRAEQEFVRQRLRAEFGREPTAEEMNEWLREQTEGY